MAGLFGGVLPAIYSAGDWMKRRVNQMVTDPVGDVQQTLGHVQDRLNNLGDLQERAFQGDKEAERQVQDIYTQLAIDYMNPIAATVWHGSPHLFSKFDASKIGTGAGAQVFGQGLYLAEAPEVAQKYADDLSSLRKTQPQLYKVDLPDEQVAQMLDWDKPLSEQPKAVRDKVQNIYRQYVSPEIKVNVYKDGKLLATDDPNFSLAQKIASEGYDSVFNKAQKSLEEASKSLPPGHALLKAKQNTLEKIKRLQNSSIEQKVVKRGLSMKEVTGADLSKAIENSGNGVDVLKNLGISGIRYLDQGSRGVGQGTSNFVIFPGNEDMLTILERNGNPLLRSDAFEPTIK